MKKRVALVLLALVCTPRLWAGVTSNVAAPGDLSKKGGTCPTTEAGCTSAAQPGVDAILDLEVPHELGR